MAGLLSALLPGLGQFYNRQWGKGAGFLLGVLALDASLGVSADTLKLFQSALSGSPSVDLGPFFVRMLPVLGLALWSIVDATHTAKRL